MTAPSSHWGHSYYTENAYTCGFFRELSPNWLDFAALIKGFRPPRSHEGAPFCMLELGSGMGFNLTLLASLYPEGEFLGVDFHPDHIAHSLSLVERFQLKNLRFVEGDFLSLASNPAPLRSLTHPHGQWSYVVAHGIATWVTNTVQEALLSVASACIQPAGLFYCSYNTFPGWLASTAFRHLSELERNRGDSADPLIAFRKAAASITTLLGSQDQPSVLARSQPALFDLMSRVPAMGESYLCQEYANGGWQPLYASELHERCSRFQLTHIGTATLPELFDELLPAASLPPIHGERNHAIRETLIDLAVNKSFRRDLFVRGRFPFMFSERNNALASVTCRIQEAESCTSYSFSTSFGSIHGDPSVYASVEKILTDDGPQSLGQLAFIVGKSVHELGGIIALLLHSGRVGLDRGTAGHKADRACGRITQLLLDLISSGNPYEAIPCPAIGTAVSFNLIEVLILQASDQGLQGDFLIECVLMGLRELGRTINGPDGLPLTSMEAQAETLSRHSDNLIRHRLPALLSLGLFRPSKTTR